jgi:HEAT repeat protein
MKHHLKQILTIVLAVFLAGSAFSQDKRTMETKVADILAQFPTADATHCNRLMQEMTELGPDGIARFADLVVPPGTGDDTQARYAIESLARFAGQPGKEKDKQLVQQAVLDALEKAADKEVKAFFIRRLHYLADSKSIPTLEKYLADEKLSGPAVAVLTSIGNEKAGEAILKNAGQTTGEVQTGLIKALGELHYGPAESWLLEQYSNNGNNAVTLLALGKIGGKTSQKTIVKAAQEAGYKNGENQEMVAYTEYAKQLAANGEQKLSDKLCSVLMKKCKEPDQLHLRSAAVAVMQENQAEAITPLLLSEIQNSDKAYRNAILNLASKDLNNNSTNLWIKKMKSVPAETQAEIIHLLSGQENPAVLTEAILPSLSSEAKVVRLEAIKALSSNQKRKAVPVLLDQLKKTSDSDELAAIKHALLASAAKEDCQLMAGQFKDVPRAGQVILTEVFGERRSVENFELVYGLTKSENTELKNAALTALKNVSSPDDVPQLLRLLNETNNNEAVASIQKAIIAQYGGQETADASLILNELNRSSQKEKLVPVLPLLNDKSALSPIKKLLKEGKPSEKEAALTALINWNGKDALPVLFELLSDKNYTSSKTKIFDGYLKQAAQSDYPADQKLLVVRKLTSLNPGQKELAKVIGAAGNIKTFLSLVFVSEYLDQDGLSGVAANATMKIALPSPDAKDGLTGSFVRETLKKAMEKVTGNDSQYFKIDIREYLENMPEETGYVAIFNGENLDGWQGLVKNPIARAKMTDKELAAEQVKADKKMLENWSAKDGLIVFDGKGDNLCTKKIYKDFEMIVDWRITKEGDSGIYLRGSPQVQIWDTSLVKVGAQVGSGGLYNNQKHPSKPLVVADNAVGDWNTFRIKMVGEKVTVYLNGVLVVDNVTMENYWDRSIPIFSEGAIELQAHGNDLTFRDIYVREINAKTNVLSEDEKAAGFYSLFDGTDLDQWTGNKTDYVIEEDVLAVYPKNGGHGNLFTQKEYSDFIFRFEFQLTPGANNGLGIHAPLEGDAAYVGKELQILDNTASIYANLKEHQYHGSVYGVIAAKRGFLKPVGEWNYQEVIVKGDDIKITLNGEVILDGNVKEASKNGTLDQKDHPGLKRHTGHIGFLGHGSELKFRNIRIKEL